MDWNAQINTQTISIDIAQQAAAIRNAVDAGARIINNSWGQGSNTFSVTAKQAFVYAYNSNAVSSNAMPEEGTPEDYPNAYGQGIINVGATNNLDARA
jgi:subtilisin family serine protease